MIKFTTPKLKGNKAQVLIFVVIVLAALLLAMSAMLGYIRNISNFYGRELDSISGRYYAEAGVQRSVYLLKEKDTQLAGSGPWSDSISIDGVDVDIDIDTTAEADIYSVTSTAEMGQFDPQITATVKRRLYSKVEIVTIDEEERLVFKRYKSAKVLSIDY